jgi:DNA polymerase III delta subunit
MFQWLLLNNNLGSVPQLAGTIVLQLLLEYAKYIQTWKNNWNIIRISRPKEKEILKILKYIAPAKRLKFRTDVLRFFCDRYVFASHALT